MRLLLYTIFILFLAGCGITPVNLSRQTPRQMFSMPQVKPEHLAPQVFSIVEETYPFKHYPTSYAPGRNSATIRSYDQYRGGNILWMQFTEIPDATSISIFITSDLYWNAEDIALNLRKRIEQLKP